MNPTICVALAEEDPLFRSMPFTPTCLPKEPYELDSG
jgi:hypothetical protein